MPARASAVALAAAVATVLAAVPVAGAHPGAQENPTDDIDWDAVPEYGPGDHRGGRDDGGDGDGDGDGDGRTLRIDDDFDDLGAEVTFGDDDLTVAGDQTATPGAGVTQLETLAMAFARLGIDTVHDPVPVAPGGITAIGEDVFSFRAHGRAEGTTRFGRRLKVKVAGRANADLSLDANTNIGVQRYEAEIWDTHADAYYGHLDLRFGKQIVAWGAADMLSPNDVVNPRDLRRGFLDRPDELRLPVLALKANAYAGPLSLEGLWVPVAPVNRFELLEGDYALLGPNAATAAERRVGAIVSTLADDPMAGLAIRPLLDIGRDPGHGIETGELGAAVRLRLRRIDLATYGLWGHERNPRLRVAEPLRELLVSTPPDMLTPELLGERITELSMMGIPAVLVDYPRRVHLGASLATRIEPLGVKLEGAYTPGANTLIVPPGAGPLLGESMTLPHAGATISLDYDRGTELTVVVETAYTRVLDVPEDRGVFQYDGDQLWLTAARVQWTPRRGPVSLLFLGFVDVTTPSYAVRPALRLSGHDNLSVEIAATLFGGPEASFGGIASRNDELQLTVQYGL